MIFFSFCYKYSGVKQVLAKYKVTKKREKQTVFIIYLCTDITEVKRRGDPGTLKKINNLIMMYI